MNATKTALITAVGVAPVVAVSYPIEIVTQLIVGVPTFLITLVILSIVLRLRSVAGWPDAKQRVLVGCIAAGVVLVGCLLPRAF